MKKFLLPLLLLLIFSVSAFSQSDWKREYKDSNVTVYSRQIPNFRYKEFKSVAEVNARISTVFEVFTDFNMYQKWFGFCKDAYVVKKHSDHKITGFILIDSPWPVMDKYMVPDLYLDPSYSDGDARIRFVLTPDNYRIAPGKYESVADLKGECILEQIDSGKTRITYINAMDVGGDLPAVFTDRFRLDQVIETTSNLRRYVKKLSNH